MHDNESNNGNEPFTDYVTTPLDSILSIDGVISFHYYEYAPKYCGFVESHNFWEMVYVDGGSLICCAGDKEIHLSQGQAIFHPPNEKHQLLAMGKDSSACIFSFSCNQLDEETFRTRIISLTSAQKNLISMLYQEGRAIFEEPYDLLYQAKLNKRTYVPFGGEQIFRNILENLLLLIIRDSKYSSLESKNISSFRPASDHEIVRRISEYLNDNIYGKVRIPDLCTALSFSESYLRRVFHKYTGKSIIFYLNEIKIQQARKLIAAESLTFSQIAEILGYSSLHYFSRIFRQYVKMSPSEYKQSVKMSALL